MKSDDVLIFYFIHLGWLPENQGRWIANNLGPTLKKSELIRDVKIFAGDDQRYTFPWWFDGMKRGASNALDFISGFAMHWYWDQFIPAEVLDQTHEQFPDKILLNTESCLGDKPLQTHGPILGSWDRAEEYAIRIIQDLQHHVCGWIDWNLILNEHGGPSYINNTVDAAIVINSTTNSEFYKQPIYHVIGHFSKFVQPGCIRIATTLSGYQSEHIESVGFLCPDKTITVIFYNKSKKSIIIHYTDSLRGTYEFELKPKSINTFAFA